MTNLSIRHLTGKFDLRRIKWKSEHQNVQYQGEKETSFATIMETICGNVSHVLK